MALLTFTLLLVFFKSSLSASSLTFLSCNTAQIVVRLDPGDSLNLVTHYNLYARKGSESEWKLVEKLIPPGNVAVLSSCDGVPFSSGDTYTFVAEGMKSNDETCVDEKSDNVQITLEDPISLADSKVIYEEIIRVNQETEVRLDAYTSEGVKKHEAREVIYLNITNGCKKGPNIHCVRLSSGDSYYSDDVLDQHKIIRMEPGELGTYTAKYTITENTGYISLIFIRMTNGQIFGECFANRDLEAERIGTMYTEYLDQEWLPGNPVCGDKQAPATILWTGKISPPVTKLIALYANTDDQVSIYIDNQAVLSVNQSSTNLEKYGEYPFDKDVMHDIVIDYFQEHDEAHMQFHWDLEDPDNLEVVDPKYFWYPSEFRNILYVKVTTCGKGFYQNSEGACAECDFRCAECTGGGLEDCTACDTAHDQISVSTPPCACDQGYAASVSLKDCLSTSSPYRRVCRPLVS